MPSIDTASPLMRGQGKTAIKAGAYGYLSLAEKIRQFQFEDIRAKTVSEIELIHASHLFGHSTEEITKKVYLRSGYIVRPQS